MDRVLAKYIATYGSIPSGLMRTMAAAVAGAGAAAISTAAAKVAQEATGGWRQSVGASLAAAEAAAASAAPPPPPLPAATKFREAAGKYAGYVSPRSDDFIERLLDAEVKDRGGRTTAGSGSGSATATATASSSRASSQRENEPLGNASQRSSVRRSPRAPPLSPSVKSTEREPTGFARPADEEAAAFNEPPPSSASLAPFADGPPRSAFSKAFEHLANSLGGRHF